MSPTQSNNHGGKREGAGKPALYGKPMKRYNVILDDETVKYLRALGGNLSKGIRDAAVLNGVNHEMVIAPRGTKINQKGA